MAAKPPAKKGGAEKAKKKRQPASALYEVSGDSLSRKRKTCPKCGPSYFLAEHANRVSCGKCGYSEFKSK